MKRKRFSKKGKREATMKGDQCLCPSSLKLHAARVAGNLEKREEKLLTIKSKGWGREKRTLKMYREEIDKGKGIK